MKPSNGVSLLNANPYTATPIKGKFHLESHHSLIWWIMIFDEFTRPVGRNLIRGESPHSVGDTNKLTPSPPAAIVPPNIHQVSKYMPVTRWFKIHDPQFNYRKMLAVPHISIQHPPIIHQVRAAVRLYLSRFTVRRRVWIIRIPCRIITMCIRDQPQMSSICNRAHNYHRPCLYRTRCATIYWSATKSLMWSIQHLIQTYRPKLTIIMHCIN